MDLEKFSEMMPGVVLIWMAFWAAVVIVILYLAWNFVFGII